MLQVHPPTAVPTGIDLSVHGRTEGGVRVVSVVGEADLTTRQWLLPGLRRAAMPPPAAVVLDLGELAFCDAHSILDLADWTASTAHRGTPVAVTRLSRSLWKLWLLTGLPIPTQYASVEQAVTALKRQLEHGTGVAPAQARDNVPVRMLRNQVLGLRSAMDSQAVIEQATGIVMADLGCTAEEAFDVLARRSQRTDTKLQAVALAIVAKAAGDALR